MGNVSITAPEAMDCYVEVEIGRSKVARLITSDTRRL
jgi:hypothetical protein